MRIAAAILALGMLAISWFFLSLVFSLPAPQWIKDMEPLPVTACAFLLSSVISRARG
jgi:hypothetical protein